MTSRGVVKHVCDDLLCNRHDCTALVIIGLSRQVSLLHGDMGWTYSAPEFQMVMGAAVDESLACGLFIFDSETKRFCRK